ncbi:MAG: class I SAM-dependent methyltransferase [Candidatus Omnitrophica bacterium]|nr:class I SAM-dependent methyltransferase [Candidatus Omnitrophota bacterium]
MNIVNHSAKTKMDFDERVRRKNCYDGSLVYGARDFNMRTGRDKHMDDRREKDSRWMNPRTGRILEKFSQKRNCPLCDNNDYEILFIKNGFSHVRCNTCELVYVNPILDEKENERLVKAEDSWQRVLETEEQIRIKSIEARYLIDVIEQYVRPDGKSRVCDIGCGPGVLLRVAREKGYDVYGIEPNARCHSVLKENDIRYKAEFLPFRSSFKERFDCVFLLNVLEHLREPKAALLDLRSILVPSGIAVITVPNIDALVYRILHEKSSTFGGHTHIQFFNPKTLSRLLQETGFEIVEYETSITELDTIKNHLSYRDPYMGKDAGRFDFLTPEFIYRNELGRTLNMIGRVRSI